MTTKTCKKAKMAHLLVFRACTRKSGRSRQLGFQPRRLVNEHRQALRAYTQLLGPVLQRQQRDLFGRSSAGEAGIPGCSHGQCSLRARNSVRRRACAAMQCPDVMVRLRAEAVQLPASVRPPRLPARRGCLPQTGRRADRRDIAAGSIPRKGGVPLIGFPADPRAVANMR